MGDSRGVWQAFYGGGRVMVTPSGYTSTSSLFWGSSRRAQGALAGSTESAYWQGFCDGQKAGLPPVGAGEVLCDSGSEGAYYRAGSWRKAVG